MPQVIHEILWRTRELSLRLGFAALLVFSAAEGLHAQFRIVGPAPVSATVARRQIKGLIEKLTPANLQDTNKEIDGLINWYRDALDEEIIAAWQKDTRSSLPPLVQAWADARVAAGIIDYSWNQQRATVFLPANEPTLGMLMTRYPDTTKTFFDDLLGRAGRPAVELSPAEAQTVCRILLDLPDIRDFRSGGLQILTRYRKIADAMLEQDEGGTDLERSRKAQLWRKDIAAPYASRNAPPSRPNSPSLPPSTDAQGQQALDLFNAKQWRAAEDIANRGAAAGGAISMYVLGRVAARRATPEGDLEAAKWYRKAADKHLASAMLGLGDLYQSGRGVDQDLVEAANWRRLAAEMGDGAGMAALGRMYETGAGVEQDYAQASQWYANAASRGDSTGMYRMAACYESGRGLPLNQALAMEWYRKAAAAGSEAARQRLDKVGPALPGAVAPAAPHAIAHPALSGDEPLQDARKAAIRPLAAFPDFTARRLTQRFTAHRDRSSWKSVSGVTVDLVFQNGRESYGNTVAVPKPMGNGTYVPGWSFSAIVATLKGLMAADTNASFVNSRPATIRNRQALRYDLAVELLKSQWMLAAGGEMERVPYTGSVWIDREADGALRVEMTAHELALDLPLDEAEIQIDYDLVMIGGQKMLMPVHTERLTRVRATGEWVRDVDSFQYGAAMGASAPQPVRGEDGAITPVLIHSVEAEYSDEAKAARRNGVVRLSLVVDMQGNARDIQVVESLGMGLDENAIESVRKSKFRPGTRNGQPVECRIQMEIAFHIQ